MENADNAGGLESNAKQCLCIWTKIPANIAKEILVAHKGWSVGQSTTGGTFRQIAGRRVGASA